MKIPILKLFMLFSLFAVAFAESESSVKDTIIIDFESLKKSSWSAQEEANARLITDFVQHLMNYHDFEYVENTYGNDEYVQHNRGIAPGIPGLIETLSGIVKDFPDYTYDVKHIYADGDYVIFHSHATMKKEHRGGEEYGFNIHDTWKIKDGKIVEHWDSLQPIDMRMRFLMLLTGGEIANENGIF